MKKRGLFLVLVLALLSVATVFGKTAVSAEESLPAVYNKLLPERLSVYGDAVYPGETAHVMTYFYSTERWSGLTYKSSDESVLTIDQYGYYTGVKKGKAVITVTTANGISSEYQIQVKAAPKLTYKKTKNKKGYIVTGCKDTSARAITIPATYKGKPVMKIDGKAFLECTDLTTFVVDKDSEYFYAEDGVIFTDDPVKTLVRLPNSYGLIDSTRQKETYKVPEDTKAIGDYAFAGLYRVNAIHIPEGVVSMGDYAFYQVGWQVSVFVPNSLKSIGKNIMQNQRANVPFYGEWESYAAKYADKYNIPFGGVFEWDAEETTATIGKPKYKSAKSYKAPKSKYIAEYTGDDIWFNVSKPLIMDISSLQTDKIKEVRIPAARFWSELIPDAQGNWNSQYPAATGIYGAGYTEGKAKIIGFDSEGKAIGIYEVQGDFIFAFDKAASLAVAGGSGTHLSIFPYEPLFITKPGMLNLSKDLFIDTDYTEAFCSIVVAYNGPQYSFIFPDYMNCFSSSMLDTFGEYYSNANNYQMMNLYINDEQLMDKINLISIDFDGLTCLFDNDEFTCYGKNSYGLDSEYGKKAYEIFTAVKKTMLGTYLPKKTVLNKVTLSVNGDYPASSESNIDFGDYTSFDNESAVTALSHETVHALDQSISSVNICPSTWLEGRAEYIERKVAAKLGVYDSQYEETYDWSFLSEADKADFFRYYYFSQNRQTPYAVGYYFLKYLNENYGEDISSKIMKKIDALNLDRYYKLTVGEEKCAELFKACVTKITSETVFDDFVRDVIGK